MQSEQIDSFLCKPVQCFIKKSHLKLRYKENTGRTEVLCSMLPLSGSIALYWVESRPHKNGSLFNSLQVEAAEQLENMWRKSFKVGLGL